MEIRSSTNFVWSIRDVLGQGATGSVYKGRNKVGSPACIIAEIIRAYQNTVDKEQDACVRANLYYLRFTFSGLAMCLQSRHSITWV